MPEPARFAHNGGMRSISLLLVSLLVVAEPLAFAGQTKAVRMRWGDLDNLIRGQRVSVSTSGGATYRGTVRAFDSESLSITGGSNPRLRRAEIAEVRLTEFAGNGRHLGKLIGGAAGLLGGLTGAVAIGMDETSTHKGRDKVVAGILAVGGLPIGLLAGYFLGRQIDKEVTVIRIIPE
jgi:hypothetical protein